MPVVPTVASRVSLNLPMNYAENLTKFQRMEPVCRKACLTLHKTFTTPRTTPTLVVSNRWVEPNRSWEDPGRLVQPITMQMLLMNLGDQAAEDVLIQLRNPQDKGGDVFALGTVTVPGKSVAVAMLPVIAKWRVWKTWDVEVSIKEDNIIKFPN